MRTGQYRGLSLVELLVGLVLGLLVMGLAAVTFQALQAAYRLAVDRILLEERGQRALAAVAHLVRHAGWRPADAPALPPGAPPVLSGRDDCGQPAIGQALSCGRRATGASDALMVRLSGSAQGSDPTVPDGTMTDCGGYPLAMQAVDEAGAPVAGHAAANLLYLGVGNDGEPQLLCRYPSRRAGRALAGAWTSGALVRGVETLQFRYGVDRDGDGAVDDFLSAAEIEDGGAAWNQVRAVQVAMVLRGERPQAGAGPAAPLLLLPRRPQDVPAAPGSDTVFLPADGHGLVRKVFAATFRLRNPMELGAP